jgi:hypothetical protein
MSRSWSAALGAAACAAILVAPAGAWAQDDPVKWSSVAAQGAFDLCRADAPDAAKVADHGEVWGWPTFVPYLEHPLGFKREAGGESRRSFTFGQVTAYIEVTVQSGQVTSAAPAQVRYFRCNVAANQQMNASLEAYFTAQYGPPASRSAQTVVWLAGPAATSADAAGGDDGALKPVIAGPTGAAITRIELSRERGLDRAKLSFFEKVGG